VYSIFHHKKEETRMETSDIFSHVKHLVQKGSKTRDIADRLNISINEAGKLRNRAIKDSRYEEMVALLSPQRKEIFDVIYDINVPIGPSDVAKKLNRKRRSVSDLMCKMLKQGILTVDTNRKYSINDEYNSNWEHTAKLTASKQKAQDKARIARKTLRESSRIDNAIEEYSKELIEVFTNNNIHIHTTCHDKQNTDGVVAIVQISDPHFNELVNLPNNKYGFKKASARLAYFAKRIKQILDPSYVKHIVVAMTGDLLNSDRRLDELLSQATNRAQASFLAVDILQQFLRDLNQDYNLTCVCVSGNESRIGQEVGYTKQLVNNNYDVTIYNTLAYLFKDTQGIKFLSGDFLEQVIEVNGKNVLLFHGHGRIKGKKNLEKVIDDIRGCYAANGIIIDFIIFGHKHSAYISDNFGRSSSLVGANSFSERGLGLSSRASQNLYLIHKDGSRDAIKIDLQEVEGCGYPINKDLIVYDDSEERKLSNEQTILRIKI
jgi:predicted phosphodiesterase/predicted transcriptional regulator